MLAKRDPAGAESRRLIPALRAGRIPEGDRFAVATPTWVLTRCSFTQLSRARRVAAFYRLLDRLSDKKRAVFVLHELEGLSPSEVAKVVSAPVLTVRTRLFYARRELLGMLRDEPALEFVARELREEQIQSESDDPLTESEST